jgi:hypothetical protein
MEPSGNAPLVTPALLSALLEGRRFGPTRRAALKHLDNSLIWGDVLTVLYDLMVRPDVDAAGDDLQPASKRDNGVSLARQFVYLHDSYGRIAPIGFFWRIFSAEVINGGHGQYCFNELAGVDPRNSGLAMLIRVARDLSLDQLPCGEVVVRHLEDVQQACLQMSEQILAGYDGGELDHDWGELDESFYDNVSNQKDESCPAIVWDRHLNARLRTIIQEADTENRLSAVYDAWRSLPPLDGKQIYEIESEKASKALVADFMRKQENKKKK